MNDSSDWTYIVTMLIGGLLFASSMPVWFWFSMRSYYKEKLARQERLSLPYDSSASGMILSGLISFFCTPLGIWITFIALASIVDSDLTQHQVFAITNWITSFVFPVIITLVWILSYQGAKLFILEFKMKKATSVKTSI